MKELEQEVKSKEEQFEKDQQKQFERWSRGQVKYYKHTEEQIQKLQKRNKILELKTTSIHQIPVLANHLPNNMTKNTREMLNSRCNALTKCFDKLESILKSIIDECGNCKETTLYECGKKIQDFISTSKILAMKMDEVTSEQIERDDLDNLFDGLVDMIENVANGNNNNGENSKQSTGQNSKFTTPKSVDLNENNNS